MSTNMGNLEKLGILVIVILVVVVGVVAITPKSVDDRLYQPDETAVAPAENEVLPSPTDEGKAPADVWPLPVDDKRSADLGPNGAPPAADGKTGPVAGTGAAPAVVPAAPTFRTIKVKKGDTLVEIAKRELKSATRYQEIVDANPGISPTRLKIGMELKIPVAAAPGAAAAAPAMPGATPADPMAGPVPSPAPAVTGDRVYVVKSGDTLTKIAQRELGSSARWQEIAKANQAVLKGSTKLSLDMKLTIPGGATTTSDLAPAAPQTSGTAEHSYAVKSGDTLWLIAKNELGSESFVKELRDANADVLKGATDVRPGMTLKIPAKK